jgi:L-ascorbate metabolism protein UlaG (beta-lactamase superfamily)
LRARGLPETRLLVVTGGETVHCDREARVQVRVLPALHSCLFAHNDRDTAIPCVGDLGVSAQERARKVRAYFRSACLAPAPVGPALVTMHDACSLHDGGALAYLMTTPQGSLLVSGSAGYWQGIFQDLRPDVALLAISGRPNVDGEPYQGPAARYMADQVAALRPGRVAFCHHDPLYPGQSWVDVRPAVDAVRASGSPTSYFEMEVAAALPLFR